MHYGGAEEGGQRRSRRGDSEREASVLPQLVPASDSFLGEPLSGALAGGAVQLTIRTDSTVAMTVGGKLASGDPHP